MGRSDCVIRNPTQQNEAEAQAQHKAWSPGLLAPSLVLYMALYKSLARKTSGNSLHLSE